MCVFTQGDIFGKMAKLRAPRTTGSEFIVCLTSSDSKGILDHMSQSFVDLFGHPREYCIGRDCKFLQRPNTDRDALDELHAAVQDRREIVTQLVNYTKSGAQVLNRLHLAPFQYNGTTGFVGIQLVRKVGSNNTSPIDDFPSPSGQSIDDFITDISGIDSPLSEEDDARTPILSPRSPSSPVMNNIMLPDSKIELVTYLGTLALGSQLRSSMLEVMVDCDSDKVLRSLIELLEELCTDDGQQVHSHNHLVGCRCTHV